ncbi:glycoside hydrolase family 13 protein [Enterococcus nangangensis]|uniref:glycoside hydrolase family 13 protein n=1 Tax=Enterococcus nangangensis TaxID=2559926 RepID=UPI0010F7DA56|nr:alpha-glucosidase [Enterococcus nangangensis]
MTKWWQHATGYQIYPRSFQDSNGDGIGDLKGIQQRLPYLKKLGVDFIWLNPIHPSPNVDNGYDIADYRDIAPEYGTLADFKELLAAAHALDLKIILDLVVNHSSDQHPWFQAALADPTSKYRDYYIWEKPIFNEETQMPEAPNDWLSIFGGSVWEWHEASQQYYFHTFAKEQPDLNWEVPALRREVLDIVTFWLEMGVDGFRIDAISHIKKAPWSTPYDALRPFANFQNVPGIELFLQELGTVFKHYDCLTVGEASGVTAAQAPAWVGPHGYFDMIFEFDHLDLWKKTAADSLDVVGLKAALVRWQKALADGRGWNALYMENHDLPRSISLLQPPKNLEEKAGKALAMMYVLLQGTPFIYQGQEIGMENYPFTQPTEFDAVDSRHFYHELVTTGFEPREALSLVGKTTRDNARTMMQWDESVFAGFSNVQPWFQVNPNKEHLNVTTNLKNSQSLFCFYQELLTLKKNNPALNKGRFTDFQPENQQTFVYERQIADTRFLVMVNLTPQIAMLALPQQVENAELLLSNVEVTQSLGDTHHLTPYEARLYKIVTPANNSEEDIT